MDPIASQTAVDVYGFRAYTPAYPGGLAVSSGFGDNQNEAGVQQVTAKLGLGHQNPLFWLLILLLIVTGYLTLGFDFGVKKIGKIGASLG